VEREGLAVVLDPCLAADEGAADGDDAAGEVALVELVVLAVPGDRGVGTDAAALPDGEGGAEGGLVEGVGRARGGLEDRARARPMSEECGATW
jgi:hypothetical protein